MDTLWGYPNRVTRQEDGSYRWFNAIEVDYYRDREIYPAIWACGIIALCILLLGVVFAMMLDDWETFWIVILCDVVFAAISAVIIWLFGWGVGKPEMKPNERYEMTDDYIKTGSGKTSVYFNLKRVKELIIRADYIELWGRHRSMRVYVPREDMSFVRGFIMGRVPGDAEIRYE